MGSIKTKINSVEEYLKVIFKNYSTFKPNHFYEKKSTFFRGQNDSIYELVPSLARDVNNNNSDVQYSRFESKMINTAKMQNPDEFSKNEYPINMLSRMQHYGLPTRLLDISENALVGLYFACEGISTNDGAVFSFVVEHNN